MKLFDDITLKSKEKKKKKKEEEKQKTIKHEKKVKNSKSTLKLLEASKEVFFEDEQVVDYVVGLYISTMLGEEIPNSGILVATNKRIILYGKRPIGYDLESVDYKKITSTNFVQSYPTGQLNIETFGKIISFATVMGDAAKHLIEVIDNRLTEIQEANNLNSLQPISPAEEIKKYKELLDMDIITEKEFNTKKIQLLAL